MEKYQEADFYFEEYLIESEMNAPINFMDSYFVTNLDEEYHTKLQHIFMKFRENYPWFKTDEITNIAIQNYEQILTKVIPIIVNKNDPKPLMRTLNYFLIYEYHKLRKGESFKGSSQMFTDLKVLNKELETVPIPQIAQESIIKRKIQPITTYFNNGIYNENPLIKLFTWFIFLFVIIITMLMVIYFFKEYSFDEKIVVLIVGAPIAGAIALTSGIKSNKKN